MGPEKEVARLSDSPPPPPPSVRRTAARRRRRRQSLASSPSESSVDVGQPHNDEWLQLPSLKINHNSAHLRNLVEKIESQLHYIPRLTYTKNHFLSSTDRLQLNYLVFPALHHRRRLQRGRKSSRKTALGALDPRSLPPQENISHKWTNDQTTDPKKGRVSWFPQSDYPSE